MRRLRFTRALTIALMLAMMTVRFTHAAENPPAGARQPAAGAEKGSRRKKPSLDDELLKDLGAVPLDEKSVDVPDDNAAQGNATNESDGDDLNQELLKGLGEGEDVGQSEPSDPLARLTRQMRDVEALIARQNADDDTRQKQTQIIRDIDELIRQTKKQQQGGGRSSSSGGSSGKGAQQTAKRREVPQPQKATQEGQSAESPARESNKSIRESQPQKPEMADVRDVLKGVWGQLPERQREQMLQSYEEQFLPKYEQMIVDYFRTLAEEPQRKP